MNGTTILAFSNGQNGQPAFHTSLSTYTEMIQQQGFPETHAQFLQELRAWLEAHNALRHNPQEALEKVLEIEATFLMDAGVAGIASEHLPWLFIIMGEVFEEVGPRFRQATLHQARLVERVCEDAIQQHMQDVGCDRLEAVQYMKSTALERLQERQARMMYLVALYSDLEAPK